MREQSKSKYLGRHVTSYARRINTRAASFAS